MEIDEIPQPWTMRSPCPDCLTTEGTIIKRGGQNVVRYAWCERAIYNAPKAETGERTTMPAYDVGDFTDIEEGQYDALVQSIAYAEQPSKFDPTKKQLVVKYKLTEIEAEDGSDITRNQFVNEVGALTPRSTLYKIFSAVLANGEPLPKGQSFDTDALLGKPCRIFYGSYTKEDGSTGMKVLSVSPPKRAAAAAGGVRRKPVEDAPIDPDEL